MKGRLRFGEVVVIYMTITPKTPVQYMQGVGEKRAKQLEKLGITTVGDLLRHYPRGYQFRGHIKKLAEAESGETSAFILTAATSPEVSVVRGGTKLCRLRAFDDSGSCDITFFNQVYMKDVIVRGERYRFWGKLTRDWGRVSLASPTVEPVVDGVELPNLVPVYPLSAGLSQNMLSKLTGSALDILLSASPDSPDAVVDTLPDDIRRENRLCTLRQALRAIHRPYDFEQLNEAKRRLIFEELYNFVLAASAPDRDEENKLAIPLCDNDITPLTAQLGFELTGAQRRAINEISADLAEKKPMRRLLSGDVGSGKTAVAAAAVYIAVKNGVQAALMAPTEILAAQHYSDLMPLFGSLGYDCRLLTGSTPAAERREIYRGLSDGSIPLVIGTHALISDSVRFSRLGLVLCDEQHRFGVGQREALLEKGMRPVDEPTSDISQITVYSQTSGHDQISGHGANTSENQPAANSQIAENSRHTTIIKPTDNNQPSSNIQPTAHSQSPDSERMLVPHSLSLSATPIPRTLAMFLYGDMAMSVLDELPPGRQRVKTYVVNESYRERLNAFIRRQRDEGHQTYVVCPSIEEREEGVVSQQDIRLFDYGYDADELMRPTSAPKAAVSHAEELQKALPDLSVGCIHGKLKPSEKDAVMREFADGRLDVLVSTTVIEVGVNVPNATLMIIENADRFGLAQLHQLRGRVGRGSAESCCVLVSDAKPDTPARRRLDVMKTTYDGYKIAEYDLAERGPGDFLPERSGSQNDSPHADHSQDEVRQSGEARFKLAGLLEDTSLLEAAANAAKRTLGRGG